MKRMIGIDLGTSSSMIKTKEYRDGESPENDSLDCKAVVFTQQKMASTPTLIRERGENRWYGYDAEQNPIKDSTLHQNFKIDLRSGDSQARAQAVRLTEDFFGFLYRSYAEQRRFLFDLSTDAPGDEETLVSYPPQWDEAQREAVLGAARKAGFLNVRGMDEATASVRCILNAKKGELASKGLLQAGKPLNAVIVDMGAGTADLAFVHITLDGALKTEILGTWPPADSAHIFGGGQMDELLAERMERWLEGSALGPEMAKNIVKGQRSAIKRWKELTVSPLLASGQAVDDCAAVSGLCASLGRDLKPFPALDRDSFERDFHAHLEIFASLVNSAPQPLRDEAQLVILTGGNSQWYWIDEVLTGANDRFGKAGLPQIAGHPELILRMELPTETVARGLAYSRLPLEIREKSLKKPAVKSEAKMKPVQPTKKENRKSDFEKALELSRWVRKRIGKTESQCIYITSNGGVMATRENMFTRDTANVSVHDYSRFSKIEEICCVYENAVLFKKSNGELAANNDYLLNRYMDEIDKAMWNECVAYDYNKSALVGVCRDGSAIIRANCNTKIKKLDGRLDGLQNLKDIALVGSDMVVGITRDGHLALHFIGLDAHKKTEKWIEKTFPELKRSEGCRSGEYESDVISVRTGFKKEGYAFLVLKKDGTAAGYGLPQRVKDKVSAWRDLVEVDCSDLSMLEGSPIASCIGLQKDGRIVSTVDEPKMMDCIGFASDSIDQLIVTRDGKVKYMGTFPSPMKNLQLSSWNLFK